MESDTARRLAEAFPHTFQFRTEPHFYGPNEPAEVFMIVEPEPCIIDTAEWEGQALLHAALCDLVERAGLKLMEVYNGRWDDAEISSWVVDFWDADMTAPGTAGFGDTPTEAVLAAADEINKRLTALEEAE